MKLVLLLLATQAHAIHFELVKPCSTEPALRAHYSTQASNVGAATIEILENERVPYIGSELGLNSILNSPVDREAMEKQGEDLLAFGWCYEVNGQQPDLMPNEVRIAPTDSVRWFFGFARMRGNEWISYCEPSHLARPGKVCK